MQAVRIDHKTQQRGGDTMDMLAHARTVAHKVTRIKNGEHVIITDLQWRAMVQILPDLRTVLNPNRIGTLDLWIAYL